MDKKNRPQAVTNYAVAMRILGSLYILGALLFFFFPNFVLWITNILPKVIRLVEIIPESSEHFWVPLATSMMVMLAIIAYSAAASPEIRVLAWVHMASKCCSTLGYLYLFIFEARYFAYLVGVLTDLPIFLIVTWLALRAFAAMKKQAAQEANSTIDAPQA